MPVHCDHLPNYSMEVQVLTKVGMHGSFFGDNFGDTLFAILTEDLIAQSGGEAILSYCSDRVHAQLRTPKRNLKEFLSAKRIVFTGGGYLGEPSTRLVYWHVRFFFRHGLPLFASRALRKKYIFAGVGAGPLRFSLTRKFVAWALRGAEKVYARDAQSLRFLQNDLRLNNVELGADLVIQHVQERNYATVPRRVDGKRRIGLHLPLLTEPENIGYLVEQLSARAEASEYVFFQDFFKPGFVSAVQPLLDRSGVKYSEHQYSGAADLLDFITTLDAVITVKLHVGIVSTAMGLPTLSLSVHEKATRYFEQIQYPELNTPSDANPKAAVDRFFDIIDAGEKMEIPASVLEMSMSTRDAITKFAVS